jgi:hypothetical protein
LNEVKPIFKLAAEAPGFAALNPAYVRAPLIA